MLRWPLGPDQSTLRREGGLCCAGVLQLMVHHDIKAKQLKACGACVVRFAPARAIRVLKVRLHREDRLDADLADCLPQRSDVVAVLGECAHQRGDRAPENTRRSEAIEHTCRERLSCLMRWRDGRRPADGPARRRSAGDAEPRGGGLGTDLCASLQSISSSGWTKLSEPLLTA